MGFPLYNGSTLLDFAGATQIFSFGAGFECVWLSHDLKPVSTTENVQVTPSRTFDDPGHIDIVFVPGGGAKGVKWAMFDEGYQKFLTDAAKTADWVGCVCTGAFILAASGLLDGCQATTYWSQRENLSLLTPTRHITVPAGYPRFVIDYRNRRFTGGGVSSSIDLALELVTVIGGLDRARFSQLSNQYAPDPNVNSGDPSQAPPVITEQELENQIGFIAAMREAVEKLLSHSNPS